MDPVTGFATIVGLISIFKQERKAKEDQNREAFLGWLEEHRHEDFKEFILRSNELPTEIDRALQEDHEVIIGKLEKIDELLAMLASRVGAMGGIAHAVHPNVEISEQAIGILRQLVNSNSKEFGCHAFQGGVALHLTSGGMIEATEQRFIDDDLETLTNLGLLNVRYGPQSGDPFYGVTRTAAQLIETIDK